MPYGKSHSRFRSSRPGLSREAVGFVNSAVADDRLYEPYAPAGRCSRQAGRCSRHRRAKMTDHGNVCEKARRSYKLGARFAHGFFPVQERFRAGGRVRTEFASADE
jgi:hypothetical protein